MIITWSTLSRVNDSIVEYGINVLNSSVSGTVTHFVDGGSQGRSQWIHSVKLSGLRQGQEFRMDRNSVIQNENEYFWN